MKIHCAEDGSLSSGDARKYPWREVAKRRKGLGGRVYFADGDESAKGVVDVAKREGN